MSSSSKASAKGAERENQKQGDDALDEGVLVQANVGPLDHLYLEMVSPPFQNCQDNMRILSKIKPQLMLPSVSPEVLRCCRRSVGTENETERTPQSSPKLSANHIIELAAADFIHSNFRLTYASNISGLSADDAKDILLVQNLLKCAEKVCNEQYDCAGKLLEEYSELRINRMKVIQRLVYYFNQALCERIERETGSFRRVLQSSPHDSITKISDIAAVYQKLPLNQVIQFTGIHSVADHVSRCRKVNIVDLNISCGLQMMILIQNLAERSHHPVERVRITAVAASFDPTIEEAGFRLRILAKSLNLNFSFHVVSLEYVLNHQENALDLDPEETVVVHAAFALRHMITDPDRLEALMNFIRNINPSLMVMIEAEANVNSPVFVHRFVEALFFYGANFEYVEDCLENDDERSCLEIGFFGPAIRNIVAAEGEERKFRIVGINVWRAFFERFGMVETDLSTLAISHANLVLERFECGDSGTHCMNGKCLVVSWKDTPMCSLSAWKFQGM
ncbi:DELLA protein RGL1-like [Salvia miltiorrhiza]|uniref:DELLA protein RGL1-like n=1 Tax=Salvia miltiorrhiza TaxID=226208 RepID=UPI0025AD7840|nr:DELLA protein RGL1-like [Salvia miltiorrhiza]